MTGVPEAFDDSAQPPQSVRGEVVRRGSAGTVRRRVPQDLAALRSRLTQLAQNPAAVATATVVTGLAVNALRDVVKSGALSRTPAATPVVLTGYVVHHVHVIHHVVHHGRVLDAVAGASAER